MREENSGNKSKDRLLKFWIDEPNGRVVRLAVCQFRGWGISTETGVLDSVTFRTSAKPVLLRSVDRPDVKRSHPTLHVLGYTGTLSLEDHLGAVKDGRLKVWILLRGRIIGRFHLCLAPGVFGEAVQRGAGC